MTKEKVKRQQAKAMASIEAPNQLAKINKDDIEQK